MKKSVPSRAGIAIITGVTVAVVWAICTPLFELIFRGGIKEWDLYKFVLEPIIIGIVVGVIDYVFQITPKRKNRK